MNQGFPRRRVLLAEFQRRGVFRASAVYGSVSFVLLEAARLWTPALSLPSGGVRTVAVLILIGYPFALWTAWHYDVTDEGVDRTDAASSGDIRQRVDRSRARRWAPALLGLIGVLLLAGSAAQVLLF
ncbi:MAG: hypothetical protein M8865_09830 [marine benthic group bacterium]|nr:hypothetical protein [Gemmatimonadota bacterium]